ncbi:hypothetical protein EXE55_16105 [Burkholderia glumae]|uniref:hypothetical protein n=1 Tax=Burkholderia glumae TaxID=337 RepID=UPI0002D94CAD|nr:hypothetical protein [Burkholderia glumae]MCR1768777.1 hypothetical protein [Burkholderia glumae]QHP92334.1 hypothetical protein EXE55_16105 [Burkholderia glumae]
MTIRKLSHPLPPPRRIASFAKQDKALRPAREHARGAGGAGARNSGADKIDTPKRIVHSRPPRAPTPNQIRRNVTKWQVF